MSDMQFTLSCRSKRIGVKTTPILVCLAIGFSGAAVKLGLVTQMGATFKLSNRHSSDRL
jgi:hypothetical protein